MTEGTSLESAPARSSMIEACLVTLTACVVTYLLFIPVFDDWFGQVIVGPGALKADTNLMLWILSWGSRAILLQPLDFFQANILHPAPSTLAGAEHMAGYLPLFAPPYYLTGNAAFAFQVTLFLSFALSGAAMYALLRHWGCSRWGAAFAGLVMIAAPGKFNRAFVVQSIGWFYLPIALIYFDRVIDRGRLRDATALTVLMALQMLSSFYLAYISLAILGAYSLVVLPWRVFVRGDVRWRNLLIAGGALAVAGMVLVVFALPYVQRASSGEIPDQAEAGLRTYSMVRSWAAYTLSPHRSVTFGPSYYVGIVPLLMALYALVPGRSSGRWQGDVRVYGLWAVVFATGMLAAGPVAEFSGFNLPPLYDLFLLLPGFSSVRGANRFALGLNFAMAALAGIGISRLFRRLDRFAMVTAVVWLAAVGFTYVDFGHREFQHAVLRVPTGAAVPGVYKKLAELEHGVLLELPAGRWRGLRQVVSESEYGYYSTVHWHRILNGYTGYQPDSTTDVMTVAHALPDERALDMLVRMTGLRYVVVHLDAMPSRAETTWRSPAGLDLIERFDGDMLFRVADPLPNDLQAALLARRPDGRTFGGEPIEAVPAADRAAVVRFVEPTPHQALAGLARVVEVAVTNDSSRVWPGLAAGSERVVYWAVRWVHRASGVVAEHVSLRPLPFDLAPGQEVRTSLNTRPPRLIGDYRLEVGLSQDGEWFPERAILEPLPVVSIKSIRGFRKNRRAQRSPPSGSPEVD